MNNMKKQVAEEVDGGDFEAGQDLGDVELLPESQLGPVDNFLGHQDFPPIRSIITSTMAVTITFAMAIGKSPFQPSFMSWS